MNKTLSKIGAQIATLSNAVHNYLLAHAIDTTMVPELFPILNADENYGISDLWWLTNANFQWQAVGI